MLDLGLPGKHTSCVVAKIAIDGCDGRHAMMPCTGSMEG